MTPKLAASGAVNGEGITGRNSCSDSLPAIK